MEVRSELWKYYKRKDGRIAVRVRVNIGQQWKHVPNRAWYILPSEWSEEFSLVSPKVKNAGKINSDINATINAIKDFHRTHPNATLEELLLAPSRITAERARQEQTEEERKVSQVSLISWMEQYIVRARAGEIVTKKGRPITKGTIKSHNSAVSAVKELSKSRNVDWGDINKKFYTDWLVFLRNVKKHRESYVGKLTSIFKTLIERAMEDREDNLQDIPEVTAHARKWFVAPKEEVDKIALHPEESQAIMNLDLSGRPGLVPHRDRYIVAYYFLQRFGDSMEFDKSNFFRAKDTGGVMRRYMRYQSQKTETEAIIPVPDRVWKILEQYEFELPQMSNQKANDALKELGRLASEKCESLKDPYVEVVTIGGEKKKIKKQRWEWITTHTSRRSGATDMDEAGVPVSIIMALGGWSTEKQMRTYIKRRAQKQAERAAQHQFFQ